MKIVAMQMYRWADLAGILMSVHQLRRHFQFLVECAGFNSDLPKQFIPAILPQAQAAGS